MHFPKLGNLPIIGHFPYHRLYKIVKYGGGVATNDVMFVHTKFRESQ